MREVPAARERIERLEAQRGGGIVRGAECLAGLDLDAQAPHGEASAVVVAVHDEPAGRDRRQRRLRQRYPILVRHGRQPRLPEPRSDTGQRARDTVRTRRMLVVGFDHEARLHGLEQGHRQRPRCGQLFEHARRSASGLQIGGFDAQLVERHVAHHVSRGPCSNASLLCLRSANTAISSATGLAGGCRRGCDGYAGALSAAQGPVPSRSGRRRVSASLGAPSGSLRPPCGGPRGPPCGARVAAFRRSRLLLSADGPPVDVAVRRHAEVLELGPLSTRAYRPGRRSLPRRTAGTNARRKQGRA